jgi:hypothetical protein
MQCFVGSEICLILPFRKRVPAQSTPQNSCRILRYLPRGKRPNRHTLVNEVQTYMHLYGNWTQCTQEKGSKLVWQVPRGWGGGGGTGRRRTEGREATVRFWQSEWLDLPPKRRTRRSREIVGMCSQEMFSIMKQKLNFFIRWYIPFVFLKKLTQQFLRQKKIFFFCKTKHRFTLQQKFLLCKFSWNKE